MGCALGKISPSLAQCESACHAADNKCTWTVGNLSGSNCGSCPQVINAVNINDAGNASMTLSDLSPVLRSRPPTPCRMVHITLLDATC